MIQAPAPQLQKAALLLVMTLCVVFIYTFLHESGHALVGVLSGAEITTFSLGLWDLNPHVSLTGALTPTQRIVNNVAGVGLPLLVWLVWMLATPRRANLALQAVKLLSALVVLNTLLAWIVIPVLFWAGRAPSDDVTQFLTNSGVHPLAVTLGALLVYMGGWALFQTRTEGLRRVIHCLRAESGRELTTSLRRMTLSLLGVGVAAGLAAFSLNGYQFALPGQGQSQPPPGYALVKTLDLSQAGYNAAAVHSFTLDAPALVGIYLQVEDVRSDFFDVRLVGPASFTQTLLHAEGYTARRDSAHFEARLPPGLYQVVLTSQPSPGALSIYTSIRSTP